MTQYRTIGLFLLLAALWGSAFVAINAGLEYFPPILFAAFRFDIAGLLMLAYAAYVTDDPFPRTRSGIATVATGSVLIIAGYHTLLFIGETDPAVTSAIAAIIVGLSPLLTTGFARIALDDERLTIPGVIGLLLGFAGVIILAQPDPTNPLAGRTIPMITVFFAAASFALGSVLTRAIDSNIRIEPMEAWAMLGGAGIMHVGSVVAGESPGEVIWTAESVLAIGYLAVVASAIGYLIYFTLLDSLGPIEINLVSYVAPVFAALVGWVVLEERLTVPTAAGFVIIFTGFVLIKRRAIRAEIHEYRHSNVSPE